MIYKTIKIKNGDYWVDFHYYKCCICDKLIPECDPFYQNKDLNICDECLKELAKYYISICYWMPEEMALQQLIDKKNNKFNRYVAPQIRTNLLNNAKCKYCESTDELQIDHIKPISKGGNNNINNLQVLCKKCNNKKSNKILSE